MKNLRKLLLRATIIGAIVGSSVALAASSGKDLKTVISGIITQIMSLMGFLKVIAGIAGVGFFLGGLIKFKAYRDNPQSTPLSQPIVLLAVGGALLFFPTMLGIVGQTMFGGGQVAGTGDDYGTAAQTGSGS